MIVEKVKREELVSFSSDDEAQEVVSASVELEDFGAVFKNLIDTYSDSYGSIVRELASNGYDTHAELGKPEEPVIIGFDEDEDTGSSYIYFKDQGMGMSPQFMKDVYMKIAKSTRRESNIGIGQKGVGSKSPLSEKDEYYIDSVVDGIEYNYIIFWGDEDRLNYLKLSESETDQPNGTTVKLFLEYGEKARFEDAFKRQLPYFDNVVFHNTSQDNVEYKMYYFDNGRVSSLEPYDTLHICYHKVYYPLDFDKVGLEKLNIPVGLYFHIGELKVTTNREAINYKDHEIKIIRNRVKSLCYELINRYNQKADVYAKDLYELYELSSRKYLPVNDNSHIQIDIDRVYRYLKKNFGIDYDVKKPKYKPFEDIGLKDYQDKDYHSLFHYLFKHFILIENGRSTKYSTESNSRGQWKFESVNSVLKYIYTYKPYRIRDNKINYDVNKIIGDGYVINRRSGTESSLKAKIAFHEQVQLIYNTRLQNLTISNLKFSRLIYQELYKYVIKYTKKYEDVVVPLSVKIQKKNKRRVYSDNEIVLNDLRRTYKKDRKTVYKSKDLKQNLHIVSSLDNEPALEFFSNIFSYTKKLGNTYFMLGGRDDIKFYSATNKNIDKIKQMKDDNELGENVLLLEEFTKGKIFSKIATTFYIYQDDFIKKLVNQYEEQIRNEEREKSRYSGYRSYRGSSVNIRTYSNDLENTLTFNHIRLLEFLNTDIYSDLLDVINHIGKYSINVDDNRLSKSEMSDRFKEDIIHIAKKFNYLDKDLIEKYNGIKNWFKGIELIFHINTTFEALPHLIDYIKLVDPNKPVKFRRYEVNWFKHSVEKVKYIQSIKRSA